jgi:ribonuclease E
MKKKTLIVDAAYQEETRIVVMENGILQDFERESDSIKKIKGNIYLAKINKVEQSLQSAFIDYGSDKNGFLSFSDIHPCYYQISEEERKEIESIESEIENNDRDHERKRSEDNDEIIKTGAFFSAEEDLEKGKSNERIYKKYNIQDVIKVGQLIPVQATKEERGNKGAAMTTYISLAGRYCVLMANTKNKGGISKKIENFQQRKDLREVLNTISFDSEQSIIVRTSGVSQSAQSIKNDYDYLNKIWTTIQDISKKNKQPCFIHAEDDITRKTIRDNYSSISEIIIEGKNLYADIKAFIENTSGSNKIVKLHSERIPIFNKYKIEQQLKKLYEKESNLPSGGSIVLDQTEALVAIDVNSGKATQNSSVEETAFKTNIEAANEIARQLKLRDLAGLVVIDFIDMYEQKHRRMVEKELRDALKNDRSRIQIGKISPFGLLEISRQRTRAGFFETIADPCKNCSGTGYVKSVEIVALDILRAVRYSCNDKNVKVIQIQTSGEVISYMMNYKIKDILKTEKNYNIHIMVNYDPSISTREFTLKKKNSLSKEERVRLNAENLTGEVNKLNIKRNEVDEEGYYRKNKFKNKRRAKKEEPKKKSLLSRIFRISK